VTNVKAVRIANVGVKMKWTRKGNKWFSGEFVIKRETSKNGCSYVLFSKKGKFTLAYVDGLKRAKELARMAVLPPHLV
jgi:hypothetical protein